MQQDYTILKNALDAFRQLFVAKLLSREEVKYSKEFLSVIALKEPSEYSYYEAFKLYNTIAPYAEQLQYVKFDFSTVPKVKMPVESVSKDRVEETFGKVIGYNGKDFVIRFNGNTEILAAVKEIPGRVYHREEKYWTAPITSNSDVRNVCLKYNFDIGDAAFAMMNNVAANLENSYSAEYIELNIPVKMKFYNYQTGGVDYAHKNKRIINADDMGLGKTSQAIGGVLINDAFPCLILCPKGLRRNWENECKAWTNKKVMILDKKNAPKLKYLLENKMVDFVITNYNGVETFFVEDIKTVKITTGPNAGTQYERVYTNKVEKLSKSVVADEAHYLRNKSTRLYKCAKQVFEDKEVRICLTGTPIVKGPQDLAALLELIGRIDDFGGAYHFVREYKDMDKRFAALMSKKENELSAKEKIIVSKLKALNMKLRSMCFIRREKHQVLKELPEQYRKIIPVEIDNRKEYNLALFSLQEYMARNNFNEEAISNALRAEILVKLGMLKQISAKGKLSAVIEFAEEVMMNDEKLVIFCWYNNTVDFLREKLKGYGVVSISGKIGGRMTRDEEVQEAKERFQNDPKTRIIIVTYKKGAEGHTLTAASKIAFVELGWTFKDQGQAEARVHRIGQKRTCGYYYFLGENTVDEIAWRIIDSRRQLEQQTTGGTVEVETFRELTKAIMKAVV